MSGFEADVAMWLDSFVKTGELSEVKSQYKIILDVNGHHVTTHIVDFLLTFPDGRQKFLEAKGQAEREWRIKWKLTEALYPETPYLVYWYSKPLSIKELLK